MLRAIVDHLDSSEYLRVKELIHTDSDLGIEVPNYLTQYIETAYKTTEGLSDSILAGTTHTQPVIKTSDFDLELPENYTTSEIQVTDSTFDAPDVYDGSEIRVNLDYGTVYNARIRHQYKSGTKLVTLEDNSTVEEPTYDWTEFSTPVTFETPKVWAYDGSSFIPPTLDSLVKLVKNNLASTRYKAETTNLNVYGSTILMDRDSQKIIHQVAYTLNTDRSSTVRFKTVEGYVELNKDQFNAIFVAMFSYIQACFNTEQSHSDAIDALVPDITAICSYDYSTNWPSTTIGS